MKRDDDYIRRLLFEYEGEPNWLLIMPGTTINASEEEQKERYHILLMMDEGLVANVGNSTFRLTSSGHNFLNAIRADTNWARTKSAAAEVGGVTLGMLRDIALGYLKAELSARLGFQL